MDFRIHRHHRHIQSYTTSLFLYLTSLCFSFLTYQMVIVLHWVVWIKWNDFGRVQNTVLRKRKCDDIFFLFAFRLPFQHAHAKDSRVGIHVGENHSLIPSRDFIVEATHAGAYTASLAPRSVWPVRTENMSCPKMMKNFKVAAAALWTGHGAPEHGAYAPARTDARGDSAGGSPAALAS